jgi:transposase
MCQSGDSNLTTYSRGAPIIKVTTIGLDLAKNVFQVHGVDKQGNAVLRRQLRREQVLTFFVKLQPCLIGIEACTGAHYWARKLEAQGHTVRIMPAQFVKPYVKTNKNDVADAEAICEAVDRKNMRFVPIKSPEQQAVLALHRSRQTMIKARTGQANQIRGFLAEAGIVFAQGIKQIAKRVPALLEQAADELPGPLVALLPRLLEHLNYLDRQVQELENEIKRWHRQSELSRRLEQVPGIGVLTASALVATVADARQFKNGRQMGAWLGIVPAQHSSGGKPHLLGISKRGDPYLRTLLVHGARAVIGHATRPSAKHPDPWLQRLLARRGKNVAAVALANRNARIVWAMLAHDRPYEPLHGTIDPLATPTAA